MLDPVLLADSLEVDPAQKRDWWERKIDSVDHRRDASPEVALVSVADSLSNVRSILAEHAVIGDEVFARFRTARMGTLWYHRRLAETVPPACRRQSWPPVSGRRSCMRSTSSTRPSGPTRKPTGRMALIEEARRRQPSGESQPEIRTNVGDGAVEDTI